MHRIMSPYYLIPQVRLLVRYGLWEMRFTSPRHSMTEVALIAYLMGMGYPFPMAHRIVETWEIDEVFPGEAFI